VVRIGDASKNDSCFQIQYVYGFNFEGYGFLLSVKPKPRYDALESSRQPSTTRLGRFCLNDTSMRSYNELPLE